MYIHRHLFNTVNLLHPSSKIIGALSLLILQALFGKLLFGEVLALLWWLGASVILFGLVMINYGSSDKTSDQNDKKER